MANASHQIVEFVGFLESILILVKKHIKEIIDIHWVAFVIQENMEDIRVIEIMKSCGELPVD